MIYRKINESELSSALLLAEQVFMKFEAPEYSKKGISEFEKSLNDADYISKLTLYGAFNDNEIVGVIATRNSGSHVALFFVKGEYHRQGIGKQLFYLIVKDMPGTELTVNSSPYAVSVYRRLGFISTDCERTESGIRFTPMLYKKNIKQSDELINQLNLLCVKDANTGCNAMRTLEDESRLSAKVYSYISIFFKMLESGNSYVRNRALALIAANAVWDINNEIDLNLRSILSHITDEKPITSRECIKALKEIIQSKPYLISKVKQALLSADTSKYTVSMKPLIDKDISDLLNKINISNI